MIKTVLFDFDGVIVNSYDATIYYFQKTLADFGKRVPKKKEFEKLLGLKTHDMFKKLLVSESEEEITKIYEYSKKESIKAISRIKLINNADKVVKDLAFSYKLAIVSSRGEKGLNLLIDLYKLRKYFPVVISREDVAKHKPHPQSIKKALTKLKTGPENSVYIGDMEEDILAAKAAGVISIFVKGKKKEDYNADYSVKNVADIPKLIDSLANE